MGEGWEGEEGRESLMLRVLRESIVRIWDKEIDYFQLSSVEGSVVTGKIMS